MVAYDIFFKCRDCNEEHPLGVKIPLTDGPAEKISISAYYLSHPKIKMPEAIRQLSNHIFKCPKTDVRFYYMDFSGLYLVPIE